MRALKGIGIYIAIFGSGFCHFLKDIFGKGNSLKTFDFHIIAQGIIESHITLVLGVIRNIRGACRWGRYGCKDALKDIVQLSRAGSCQIVICAGGLAAEVPVVVNIEQVICIRISGIGIVAGDCLHELVFS